MNQIVFFILQCFYFMLPAYFANMAPVIMKNTFKSLAVPVDRTFGMVMIFGENKTYRGIIFGIVFAVIISYIQFLLFSFQTFRELAFFDYKNWLLFGFLMGAGALLGDLAKSFVKRRLRIEPGKKLIPWDQWDFVIGAMLFSSIIFVPSLYTVVTILLISFLLHVIVNHIAFYLKIRNEKW